MKRAIIRYISDSGLKRLTGLAKLKVLGVQYTYATTSGIAELKSAIPNVDVRVNPPGGNGNSG